MFETKEKIIALMVLHVNIQFFSFSIQTCVYLYSGFLVQKYNWSAE